MHRPLLVAAVALAALTAAAPASAETVRAKNVSAFGQKVSCYATIPAEGRGIVCNSDWLKPTRKTMGVDPYIGLKPRGRAVFGGRGDYGGYDGKAQRLRMGDRWVWHGIACTVGKDGMTCLNRDDRGFNLGPAGHKMLG
ncbi:MAG TPA: hypothetical protein VIL49_09600 [Capillimicrobium sp.]|jgi:hypothetical protein